MPSTLSLNNRRFLLAQTIAACIFALGSVAHAQPQPERMFYGHSDAISAVAFSPDGKKLASVSKDRTLHMYNPQTQQQLLFIQQCHNDIITTLAFSPDGKRIATGSADKSVKIWDATGNPNQPNVQNKEQLLLKGEKGHTDVIMSVAFSADGKWIVTGSLDKTIRVWDAAKGGNPELVIENADAKGVVAVAISPDGSWIASGGLDKTVRLWDSIKGKQQWKLEKAAGHIEPIYSLSFSQDGKTLASASSDATVKLIDVEKGAETGTLKNGHKDTCNAVAFSQDGKTIYTCGDGLIKIWDASSKEVKQTIRPTQGNGELWSVSVSSDGKYMAAGGQDNIMKVWDLATLPKDK